MEQKAVSNRHRVLELEPKLGLGIEYSEESQSSKLEAKWGGSWASEE